MISWEFLVLIFLSFAIAIPITWFLMTDWLENYVYRYKIGTMEFFLTILLLIIPTALTVSYHAYKAATSNPANSMRIE
jgi:hypothetical protein